MSERKGGRDRGRGRRFESEKESEREAVVCLVLCLLLYRVREGRLLFSRDTVTRPIGTHEFGPTWMTATAITTTIDDDHSSAGQRTVRWDAKRVTSNHARDDVTEAPRARPATNRSTVFPEIIDTQRGVDWFLLTRK